jgi:hypothetical protein
LFLQYGAGSLLCWLRAHSVSYGGEHGKLSRKAMLSSSVKFPAQSFASPPDGWVMPVTATAQAFAAAA